MAITYLIGLSERAVGLEMRISEPAREFLAQFCNKDCWYTEYLLKAYGLDRSGFEPFGDRFGYNGILELWPDGSVEANYSQAKDQPLTLSGSLFVLFKCLNGVDDGYTEPVEIELELEHGTSGSAIHARFSADFHRWLSSKHGYASQASLPEARQAMIEAGRILFHDVESYARAEIGERGGVTMHCDRNCCCLGPGGHVSDGEPFTMSTHNCDNTTNQLIFLAGLAALSDQYNVERGVRL